MTDLDFICSCLSRRRILWTYHVNMRMRDRSVTRDDILSAADSFEIIENYPADRYFPSCLVVGRSRFGFHVVFAMDREGDLVHVVTAYRPSAEKWEADGKRRRKP